MDNFENQSLHPCNFNNSCRNVCGNGTKKAVNIIGSCDCCNKIVTCDDVCKCFCDSNCCNNLCRKNNCGC